MIALADRPLSEAERMRLVRSTLRQRVRMLVDRARHASDTTEAVKLQAAIGRHVLALTVVAELMPSAGKEMS